MVTFEEEFKRVEPVVRRWVAFLLLAKKIEVRRQENFVREGPNIIIGNHCGAAKDVAVVLRIVPRFIFFTANQDIFTREQLDRLIHKHLKRHLKDFGPVAYSLIKPLRYMFVRFISTNINRVGTIPVDFQSKTREARRLGQEYLQKGRAIIALQGRGRVQPKEPHPYVSPFRPGTSIMAYNLYRDHNISVPFTPLALYGTQTPWLIPAKIHVNVGEPMYISSYLGKGFDDSVENFRSALEARVKVLFREVIRT